MRDSTFPFDNRDRFLFAAEAADIGYWFCDLPFDRLVWDDRVKNHFWLRPNDEVDIELFYERIHPDDREPTRRAIDLSIDQKVNYEVEYRTVSAQGLIKWIRAVGRAAYRPDGTPIRFDGITRDVTALKVAEEARDHAREALFRNERLALVGRLAATIAHEIKNPIASVTDILYLLEDSSKDSRVREYVKLARAEVHRVSDIVTHTLQFNRGSETRCSESASTILDSALGLFEGRIRQTSVVVRRDYDENDRLFCLPRELRQVFANLVGNALDAIQIEGKLTLKTQVQRHPWTGETGVRVTIADSGGGMNPETLKRLFEPFVTTKGDRGSGLGLWVSREILERHGAKIRVRSRQLSGKSGTIFTIFFPDLASKTDESLFADPSFGPQ